MRFPSRPVLALSLLAPASAAQVIDVPGDYATPQEAVDAAPDGAVIRIQGGHWPQVVIDRPLTLIGPAFFEGGDTVPPIVLAGPGSGRVVLSDIQTGAYGFNGFYVIDMPAGIEGGGFDELHVLDSLIEPPRICSRDYGCRPFQGWVDGTPGIATDVPMLVIERSQVWGSNVENEDDGTGLYVDAPPGILAPASEVIALDSVIGGGSVGEYYTYPAGTCDSFYWACNGGRGGDAVIAAALHHANTELRGGYGASWYERETIDDPYERCECLGMNGAPAVTGIPAVELRATLRMPAPPQIGTTLALVHHGAAGAVLLFDFDLRLPSPTSYAPGLYFLGTSPTVFGTIANGPVLVPIPSLPVLVGSVLAFQTIEPRIGLAPPVAGVVR